MGDRTAGPDPAIIVGAVDRGRGGGSELQVLVTGAAGFIGSHLCETLLADGHRVVGVDAFVDYYARERKERNLAGLRGCPGFTFHEADLRAAALEPLLEGVDVVVNEAGMPGLARSWTDTEAYLSCNVLAVQRLSEAAVRVGLPRLVHVSTSSVYGTEAVGDEATPTRPISPYGVTKLAAEHLLMAYHDEFGLPALVLRYFSIYGPRQRPEMAYALFTEKLLDGRAITVYGDGRQSRSNTYVSDCVAGTVAALERGEPGEVYNIGGGQELALIDAIGIIAGEVGVEPQLSYEPPRRGDQRRTAADVSKARRVLGYEPLVRPEEGLRRQVAWHVGERSAAVGAAGSRPA
jgi:UDP-glucuronate 4-epimerase